MGLEADQRAQLERQVYEPLLVRPPRPLEGKAGLITGATRPNGLGRHIGERLASEGLSPIIIVGTKASRDIAPYVVARLERYNVEVHALVGDITDQQNCAEIMKRAYEISNGNVNILVNNAGTNMVQPFTQISEGDVNYGLDAKVKGTLFTTQQWFAIRNDEDMQGGNVVNIGSIIGNWGMAGNDVYAGANAFLRGFTQTRARGFGDRGITVNMIEPGFVPGTEMSSKVSREQMDTVQVASALNQLVRPEDVAGAVSYLVGPDGQRITGTVLVIDAGLGSAYTALPNLHKAGHRFVPREARSIVAKMGKEEVDLIKAHWANKEKEGTPKE